MAGSLHTSLQKKIANLKRMRVSLPIKLANASRNFFVASWDRQGWLDAGLESWPPRARETKRSKGKAILVDRGFLRRAVRNSIREVNWNKVRLVVDLPYAAIHNDGGEIQHSARESVLHFGKNKKFSTIKKANTAMKVSKGAYTQSVPKRQYMGTSRTLTGIHIDIIKKEMQLL